MVDVALKAEVETELARARDVSETRTLADLREATGAGHDDLTVALDELRAEGRVSEVAPGEWLPFDTNAAAREAAAERQNGHTDPDPGISLREAERASRTGQPPRRDDVRVHLDAAVAAVMDSDALGKLVEAGIQKADERGVGFVFEVRP